MITGAVFLERWLSSGVFGEQEFISEAKDQCANPWLNSDWFQASRFTCRSISSISFHHSVGVS